LCLYHCFLDDDKAGREAFKIAEREGLIIEADATFSTRLGVTEAEIEDLYDVALYQALMIADYGVSLEVPRFKSRKKWSERMDEVFRTQGKSWDDEVKRELKAKIARLVVATPGIAVNPHQRSVLEALAQSLGKKLRPGAV
jgi:hypothetical protein